MAETLDPSKTQTAPDEGVGPDGKKIEKKPDETPEQKAANLEKRMRDHQARADRAEEFIRKVTPVLAALEERPEIVEMLSKGASKKDEDPQPTPPAKPAHFDYIAAYNDPTSESFKYEQAKRAYDEARLEWMERRERRRDEERQQAIESQKRHSQVLATMEETKSKAQTEFGMSPEEAAHFVAFISDDKNVTMANLVAFYRAANSKRSPQVPEKKPGFGPAPPASQGGGGGHQEIDANVEFNDSIRRTNPSRKTLFPRTSGTK